MYLPARNAQAGHTSGDLFGHETILSNPGVGRSQELISPLGGALYRELHLTK